MRPKRFTKGKRMDNLISVLQVLWQSGIAPALLIMLIGLLIAHFKGNQQASDLLQIAYKAVLWAEKEFDGGVEQKAQAINKVAQEIEKLDKAHVFTVQQIDDAIEWAVKRMKAQSHEEE